MLSVSSIQNKTQEDSKTEEVPLSLVKINENIIDRILNISDEMYLQFGRVCDFEILDLTKIKSFLPKKMIQKFDKACTNISFTFTLNYALSKLINAINNEKEDDDRILETRLNSIANCAVHELSAWFKEQLSSAGVSNVAELILKSSKISSYKELAEQRYLSDPENLRRRKTIELEILTLYSFNSEEWKTIAEYWEWAQHTENGWKEHWNIENKSKDLFSHTLSKFAEILETFEKEDKAKIYGRVYALGQDLANQLAMAREEKPGIVSDYFYVKGKMIIDLVLHRELRKYMQLEFDKTKEIVKLFGPLNKNRCLRKVEHRENSIKYWERAAEETKAIALNKKENSGTVQFSELANQFQQKALKLFDKNKKSLQKLAQRNTWDWAYKTIKVTDDTFELTLNKCKETPCEKKFFASSKIAWGQTFLDTSAIEGLNVDRDISTNLNQIPDPISYFANLIKVRDEERLQLQEGIQINEL